MDVQDIFMGNLKTQDNNKNIIDKEKNLSIGGIGKPSLPVCNHDKLKDYFLNSWETFSKIPFPSRKDEAWRRTSIEDLAVDSLLLTNSMNRATLVTGGLTGIPGRGYSGLIQLDGSNLKLMINHDLLDSGLIFIDFQSALQQYPDLLCTMLGSIVPASDGKFAALTSALAGNGALLFVPQGQQLNLPFRITIDHSGLNPTSFYHFIIWLESGSSASVIIDYVSHQNSIKQSMIGDVVEINVGEDAKLELCEIQALGTHAWSLSHQRARLYQGGEMTWVYGGVGSRLTKKFMDVDLVGKHAKAKVGGLFISDHDQHFDFDTQQNHFEANTTSDLLFKGALKGKSRSVWQGMIHVAPNAKGADGYQKSSTLILSRDAKASAIPGLEILNNDVKCSHGATISNISPDELFYLQTRGVSREEGEKLLLRGFFSQIAGMIENSSFRTHFDQMIDKKLGK